jgi:hypothetical protein
MKSFLTGIKDKAISEFGKFILKKWGLDKYGEIHSLTLRSNEKCIDGTILLKGEENTIAMTVEYRIESVEKQTFFIADKITFSREWANLAFQDFCLPDVRRFEIHSAVAALV